MSDAEPDDFRLKGIGMIIPEYFAHEDPVWHYTDAAGLIGIVSGGKDREHRVGRLWATAATILNDPDELAYGAQKVAAWFAKPQNELTADTRVARAIRDIVAGLEEWILSNPAYVVCASADRDSLVNWRGYAGGGGYAVRLETLNGEMRSRDDAMYGLVDRPNPDTSFSLAPAWVKVAYTEDHQNALIGGVVRYLMDERSVIGRIAAIDDSDDTETLVRALMSGLAAAMKEPSFRSENEVRLIAFPHHTMTPQFRGTARGVVPYLEVEVCSSGVGDYPPKPLPLPILDVWVGPPRGEAMDQRVRTANILLASTGRQLTANRSNIPFIP